MSWTDLTDLDPIQETSAEIESSSRSTDPHSNGSHSQAVFIKESTELFEIPEDYIPRSMEVEKNFTRSTQTRSVQRN